MNMDDTLIIKMANRLSSIIHGKGCLKVDSDLKFIEKSGVADGQRDWSIIHAGIDGLEYKGEGQKVAILDTGVDKFNKDFGGRAEFENFVDGTLYAGDSFHGTFCAGEIIANGNKRGVVGVAPLATAYCCKVLYGDGRDRYVDFETVMCNAILEAGRNDCGVISMSLGSSYKSLKIQKALEEVVFQGVIPIAAAGNDGMNGSLSKSYPASYDCCISVAAANEKGLPTWFSTVGKGDIVTECPEIAVASKEFYWGLLPNNSYGKMVGTSQACPIIAGVALLWREAMVKKDTLPYGEDILKAFRQWLKSVSVDTNMNGWDNSLGWGVLSIENGDL